MELAGGVDLELVGERGVVAPVSGVGDRVRAKLDNLADVRPQLR